MRRNRQKTGFVSVYEFDFEVALEKLEIKGFSSVVSLLDRMLRRPHHSHDPHR